MAGVVAIVVPTSLLSAAALLSWAAVRSWRQRSSRAAATSAAIPFAGVCTVLGCGAGVLAAAVVTDAGQPVITGTAVLVGLLLPLPWVLFGLAYTGRTDLVSREILAAVGTPLALGVLATVVVVGSQRFGGWSLPSPATAEGLIAAVVFVVQTLQALALLFAGGLMLVGTGVILLTFRRYDYLDDTTGALLGVLGTIPWLSVQFGLIVRGVPITAAGGFLTGALAVVGVTGRGRLFPMVAAAGNVGPETVMADLEDIVVVTDGSGTVVDLNGAAETTLNGATDAVGGSIGDLLGAPITGVRTAETLELRTADGQRLFEPSVSELTDQHDSVLGHAVVLRDVTDRRTRKQRLEVLNRVLRHNLRNDVTVLLANAQQLEAAVEDPQLVASAETVVETTRELASLSESAREVETLLSDPPGEELFRLITVSRDVIAGLVNAERVDVECDVPVDIVVEGPRDLLEAALGNLVENAIEHTEGPTELRVRARHEPDRPLPLTISVADDGDGISEAERRVVLQGRETAMDHGSGMGLWLVRWAATELGGDLEIDDREGGGTVVRLKLPGGRREGSAAPVAVSS